eukprot:1191335-Prorocentrum_minimum.AAC.5
MAVCARGAGWGFRSNVPRDSTPERSLGTGNWCSSWNPRSVLHACCTSKAPCATTRNSWINRVRYDLTAYRAPPSASPGLFGEHVTGTPHRGGGFRPTVTPNLKTHGHTWTDTAGSL